MACTYCFYLEKAKLFSKTKTHRMSDEILEEMIRQVMHDGEQAVSFGWQGGEPTLMGLTFFQKAVVFQEQYGKNQSVGNGLQTNGILLDKDWAIFLASYHFLIGLSLDGPAHVHDRYRHLQSGKGSWSIVTDRAKLLLNAGVEVNALSVINDYSVGFPEEIYEFHKSLGLNHMQFIPCVETDIQQPNRAAPFSVKAEEFGQFLITIFDLWRNDFVERKPTTFIRFFDSVFYHYVGMTPPQCTLVPECGIYVVVEHNGDVYSCDFFVEDEWKLGNVLHGNLKKMLNSERQTEFGKRKAMLPSPCLNCKWKAPCWGGCVKDRVRDPQDNGLNHFCEAYKMFFEYADPFYKKLADDWKKEQSALHAQNRETNKIDYSKVGRNDPCPCGSGLKFKRCCGR